MANFVEVDDGFFTQAEAIQAVVVMDATDTQPYRVIIHGTSHMQVIECVDHEDAMSVYRRIRTAIEDATEGQV